MNLSGQENRCLPEPVVFKKFPTTSEGDVGFTSSTTIQDSVKINENNEGIPSGIPPLISDVRADMRALKLLVEAELQMLDRRQQELIQATRQILMDAIDVNNKVLLGGVPVPEAGPAGGQKPDMEDAQSDTSSVMSFEQWDHEYRDEKRRHSAKFDLDGEGEEGNGRSIDQTESGGQWVDVTTSSEALIHSATTTREEDEREREDANPPKPGRKEEEEALEVTLGPGVAQIDFNAGSMGKMRSQEEENLMQVARSLSPKEADEAEVGFQGEHRESLREVERDRKNQRLWDETTTTQPPQLVVASPVEQQQCPSKSNRDREETAALEGVGPRPLGVSSAEAKSRRSSNEYNPAELFGGMKVDGSSSRVSRGSKPGYTYYGSLWTKVGHFFKIAHERDLVRKLDNDKERAESVRSNSKFGGAPSPFKVWGRNKQQRSITQDWRTFRQDSIYGTRHKSSIDIQKTKENIMKSEATLKKRLRAKDLILLPENSFFQAWQWVMAVVFVYNLIHVPFHVCFYYTRHAPVVLVYIEMLVSFLLLVDVVVILNTGVYNSAGVLTCTHRDIVHRYSKSWLVPDLMAAIPYALLSGEVSSSFQLAESETAHRIFKLLVLLRIPKLFHMNSTLDSYFLTGRGKVEQLRMLKVVLCILLLCHYNTCFWYLVGISSQSDTSWLEQAKFKASEFDNDSSLDTIREKYLLSFYASVVSLTTVGYGDITPTNNMERTYSAVMLLVGSAVFSFLIASTSNYISQIDALEHHKQQQLQMLNSLIDHHHLEDDLRNRIIQYAHYQLERDISGDQNVLLKRLPFPLRREVMMKIHGHTLSHSLAFEGIESAFLQRLVVEIEVVCFLPNQSISQAGDHAEHLVILNKGFVEEFTVLSIEFFKFLRTVESSRVASGSEVLTERAQTVSILSHGHMWGEAGLLGKTELLSRRSVTFVEAAEISLHALEGVLGSFPNVALQLRRSAAKRHAKYLVLTRKLTDTAAQQGDEAAQFAREFLLARSKISSLLELVKRAYESHTFTEEEVRSFLTVKKATAGEGRLNKMQKVFLQGIGARPSMVASEAVENKSD